MQIETKVATNQRPLITDYAEPAEFMRAMIEFLKKSDRSFSVYAATATLRKVSPALVSLIVRKQRNITIERVDKLSKLL